MHKALTTRRQQNISHSRKWVGYLRYIFIKDCFLQVVCRRFGCHPGWLKFVRLFWVCDNWSDINMIYNHNKPMLLFKVSIVPYSTCFTLSSTSVLKIPFLILPSSFLVWQSSVRKLVCTLTTALQVIKSALFLVPESKHSSWLSFLKVEMLLSAHKDLSFKKKTQQQNKQLLSKCFSIHIIRMRGEEPSEKYSNPHPVLYVLQRKKGVRSNCSRMLCLEWG